MMLEFFYHLASFDLPWLFYFISLNFFWIFAFAAAMYISNDGVRPVGRVAFLVITLWAFSDILALTSWKFEPLLPFMVLNIFFYHFLSGHPWVQKRAFPLFISILLITMWAVYSFF